MKNTRLALVTPAPASSGPGAVIIPIMGADVAAHIRWMQLRGLSENTVRLRKTVLGLLVRSAGRPLADLTREDIDAWQDGISVLAAETRLAYVSAVRSYYRWALAEQRVTTDPSAVLIVPKVPRGLPHPVSERHMEWAIAHAPDPIRVWLEIAAYAGARAAEIAVIERADVHDDADNPGLLLHGKGGKERVVPLSPGLLRSLQEHGMPWRGRLFPGATPKSVSRRCNRWLHRHGITDTLHCFRHRFATQLYEASGHDLVLVQILLGHASVKTTTVYTLVNARAGAAAVARIDRPLLRPAKEA